VFEINEYFYRLHGRDDFVQKNHSHNEIEFIQVISGSGTVLKNDKTYLLQSQYIYVIDARNAHIVYPQENCENYVRNKIVINADSFVGFCGELGIEQLAEKILISEPISTAENPEIDKLFKMITELCTAGSKGLANGYMLELVHWIHLNSNTRTHGERDTTIQKILNIIAEKEGITSLSEISGMLHMDKYYICHLFKDKTGRNLSDYLSDKVYEKSCKLLAGTSYSVEKIAFMCGFSTASSMTRFFKNRSGMSPTKFRKEKQQSLQLRF